MPQQGGRTRTYLEHSIGLHPQAVVRAVAVTNAPAGTRLKSVVYEILGEEAAEYDSLRGWKLLPLETIGSWVQCVLEAEGTEVSDKMKVILRELVRRSKGSLD